MSERTLDSDWNAVWPEDEVIQGKYQRAAGNTEEIRGRYGEQTGGLTACKTACESDTNCMSVGEDLTTPGRCWLSHHTKNMTGWFTPAAQHNMYFKHKTNATTKEVDVGILYDGQSGYADYFLPSRGDGSSLSCTVSDGTTRSANRWNYWNNANGKIWDNPNNVDVGCPKIGVITGGDIVSISCPTSITTGQRFARRPAKAICRYNRLYNTSDTVPPGYTASTLANLDRYFEGDELVKAKQTWCMGSSGVEGFDNILANAGCSDSDNGFDYRLLLAELLPDDWYETAANCDRMITLGEQASPNLTQAAINKIISKINLLPNNTRWKPDAIRALNRLMLNDRIPDRIKNAIEAKTKTYCTTIGGADKVECSCFNAIEGYESNINGGDGCTKGEKGCDDALLFLTIRKRVQELDSTGSSLFKLNATWNPNRDSAACKTAHTANDNTILAYKQKEPGEARIIQLCETVIQSLDQSTLSILGGVNVVCDPVASAVNSYTQGTASGGGGGDNAGTPDSGDEEDTKKTNIWIWVIVAVFSCFMMLGVGAAMLFLL